MRKLLISSLIIVISTIGLYGQNGGHKFEVGVGYAPLFLVSVDDGQTVPYKCNTYLEWRYDFGKHVDVGARLDYKTFPTSSYDMSAVVYKGTQHDVSLLAFADFNFQPGQRINPFIGCGIGPGVLINHWKSSEVLYPEAIRPDYHIIPAGVYPEYILVVCPRIGLELFRHLRLSASVDCSLSDTRWPVCLNVGWTF